MTRLLILGTGLLAEELTDLIAEIPGFVVEGYVENLDRTRTETPLLGKTVHWVEAIDEFKATHKLICGISTTLRVDYVESLVRKGFTFATLVHPTARVSTATDLAEGVIVSPGVIIASRSHIGRFVFLNRGVLIGHHTRIAEYCSIQPGANIAGACSIGAATYVGMGAIVIDQLEVGSGVVIGAGSVVTKPLPDHVLAVGVPARIVKTDISRK